MIQKVLTFLNNKGGVGKTSLIYHLAWISAKSGKKVVAVDLDTQANLTAAFLEEDIRRWIPACHREAIRPWPNPKWED